jgi:hypothetical protein
MNPKSILLKALSRQIVRLQKRIQNLQRLNNQFSWYRLGIFFGGLGFAFLVYWFNVPLSWWVIGGTLIVFNFVAWLHRRTERSLKKHQIWHEMKITQQARILLDWPRIPAVPEFPHSLSHPFEVDLNITGARSLQHLLDISVTRSGSARLRHWLLETNPCLETILERQELIQELKQLSGFREKLVLNFKLVSEERLDSEILLKWLREQQSGKSLKWILPAAGLLAGANAVLIWLSVARQWPAYWLISLILYGLIYFSNWRLWGNLLDDAILLDREFEKSMSIFKFLENYRYCPSSKLARLCHPFRNPESAPSKQLRHLKKIFVAIGLRSNIVLGTFLNIFMPWDFYWAGVLNRYRNKIARIFPEWLETIFELEALSSLAHFAYLNPEYTLPELRETVGDPARNLLETRDCGHPLITAPHKISNTFSLNRVGDIALITGSNMAGKSTFLRTLGINLVLAFAGAPVNAGYFSASMFRVFSCIQINDSLQNGVSQFYAEVKRLKALLDWLEADHVRPVFFLIDEIYKGTNNRERLIGSRALLKSLIHQNGLGAISTHDLELTVFANQFNQVMNYHFREEVAGGKMVFDYRLRTGPCPTTNALKIMQMEGLPIEPE